MRSGGMRAALCAQVWTNCRLYNAEGSDISRACKRLEKHALAAWKEHELPRKHGSAGEPLAGATWRRDRLNTGMCISHFRAEHSPVGAAYSVTRVWPVPLQALPCESYFGEHAHV